MLFSGFFCRESKTVIMGGIIIGCASILSRVLGLVRDKILTSIFGATTTLDQYYTAILIPDLVYILIVSGVLSASFIPIFSRCLIGDKTKNQDGQLNENARSFVNLLITLLLQVIVGVNIILWIFMPYIIALIAPQFTPAQLNETVLLSRIMLMSTVFFMLSGVLSGILQVYKRFLAYSLAAAMYNVGIILGAIFFTPFFGLSGLALGVVLGAFLHFFIHIPALRGLGYKYQFLVNFKDKNLRDVFRIMPPRALTLGLNQLNLFILSILALNVAYDGGLSIFNLANNLQGVLTGVVGISLAISAFPKLSLEIAKDDSLAFIKTLRMSFLNITHIVIPLSVMLYILREQVVTILFSGSKVDFITINRISEVLMFFCIGVFAQSLIPLFLRVFYALKNTLIPLVINIVVTIITIISGLYLSKTLGVAGLALSFSLSGIMSLSLLWIMLRLRYGLIILDKNLFRSLVQIGLVTIISGFILQLFASSISRYQAYIMILVQTILAGLISSVVYLGIIRFKKGLHYE